MRGLARVVALLAPLVALGCGYSAGLRVPEGARTVGVEVFGNQSPLRNLGAEVTAELTRSVSDLVPLPLVPPDRADYVVRGDVIDYSRRGGARDAQNQRLETGITLGVWARLVDRRTGEEVESTIVALATGIVIERGVVADDTPEEVAARDRAIENLATKIVLDLFRPGGPDSGR